MADKQITKQWHDATARDNFVFGKTIETRTDSFPDTFLNYVDFGIVSGNKERESVAIKPLAWSLISPIFKKPRTCLFYTLEQFANDNRDDL